MKIAGELITFADFFKKGNGIFLDGTGPFAALFVNIYPDLINKSNL